MLSTCAATTAVLSSDAAGGRLMLTKTAPISSSGTKPDGRSLSRTKNAMLKRTIADITSHFLPEKKSYIPDIF